VSEYETSVRLPGGNIAAHSQVAFVRGELERVRRYLEEVTGLSLTGDMIREGIVRVNRIRKHLHDLRRAVFCAPRAPLPALELLIAEMLAIHYCSDQALADQILRGLVRRVEERIVAGEGYGGRDSVRVFWVNPVADLRAMGILERCGGRICGTEYLFTHALDEIPLTDDPLEGLAQMAMADPMVGPSRERAMRICRDIAEYGSEALVISRIPGASHCALEGEIIARHVREVLGVPVVEVEVPPLSDAVRPALESRLTALVEIVRERRLENH
jgi:benzoyl-CoA reductase/2-hydroxyglutaryl-CoA dehydratase subunit BcrC/BadD/HgdB